MSLKIAKKFPSSTGALAASAPIGGQAVALQRESNRRARYLRVALAVGAALAWLEFALSPAEFTADTT
jgi:hypothetical protein